MRNRIREWREKRGLTLERLGEATGTSTQQISRLEHGQRRLTDEWLGRLATALSVDKADLIIENSSSPCRREFTKDKEEIRLLMAWRALDDAERDIFIRMLEGLPPPA